jgi:ADP-heptose:LPS heptosyltransferase
LKNSTQDFPGTSTKPNHILVSRTDKIGDLMLSLPVFQTIRKAFPEARITALVSSNTKEIVQGHPAVDAVETVEKNDSVLSLARRFKKIEADVFILLYPRPKLALAAWLAKIPVRIGTAFRWYSMFLNRRIKVHRSACERHEVEYNLDLVRPLGVTASETKIEFPLAQTDRDFARDLLREKGIPEGYPYMVVHPGHKGSALNWKPERYGEAVERLCRTKGLKVVITAGADETALVSRVTAMLPTLAFEQRPVLLIGECTLKQLAAVYAKAVCFLSGSTGTMHLAAAVGTPTVSLFCPIPETTPVRWGPWGNKSTVLMPQNMDCPDCRIGSCIKHDPMDVITLDEVLDAVRPLLHKVSRK